MLLTLPHEFSVSKFVHLLYFSIEIDMYRHIRLAPISGVCQSSPKSMLFHTQKMPTENITPCRCHSDTSISFWCRTRPFALTVSDILWHDCFHAFYVPFGSVHMMSSVILSQKNWTVWVQWWSCPACWAKCWHHIVQINHFAIAPNFDWSALIYHHHRAALPLQRSPLHLNFHNHKTISHWRYKYETRMLAEYNINGDFAWDQHFLFE